MAFPSNPVATGRATKTSQWDTLFNATEAIYNSLRALNELYIPAAAFRPHASGGCGPLEDILLSSGRYVQGMPFDPTSIESASLVIPMPKRWNRGTFTFQPLLMNTAGGSGAVVFQLASVAASDDDPLDVAVGTFQTSTDTVLTAKDFMLGPQSAAITMAGSPAVADLSRFVVQRDPTAGGDTYGSDMYLLGVILRITVSEPNDA